MCRYPIRREWKEFGCGRCLPCRINRERLWTIRILLEAGQHEFSSFITLTYRPEEVPDGGTVVPDHLVLFWKRLRERVGAFRYFAVGEYGDESQRPHYHAALFGLAFPDHKNPDQLKRGAVCECALCLSWGLGLCHVGILAPESASYMASYTVKRMTNPKDARVQEWLQGRHPEFCRMSLKPGIGAHAAEKIGAFYTSRTGSAVLTRDGDVSAVVRQDKRFWPLGRYLRSKVRESAGMETNTPEAKLRELENDYFRKYWANPDQIAAVEGRRVRSELRAVARVKHRSQKGGKS